MACKFPAACGVTSADSGIPILRPLGLGFLFWSLTSINCDRWVAQANNASFGAQAAYDELVPGFETLFAREGGNWQAFYEAVRQLARMPKNERLKILAER